MFYYYGNRRIHKNNSYHTVEQVDFDTEYQAVKKVRESENDDKY